MTVYWCTIVFRGRYQKIKIYKKLLLLLVLLSPAIVLVQEISDEPAADAPKEQTEPA